MPIIIKIKTVMVLNNNRVQTNWVVVGVSGKDNKRG